MNLYIYGTGILSAAGSNSEKDFLKNSFDYSSDRLLCKEPDYTAYIPAMQLRRMSKAARMGIGAARICLQHAGIEKADAISVGTAFGCLNDTEVFLSKMVSQNEQMLTPTAFIQSTHNTVAGQIALLTGCYGHNLTYVHRGHSFEHAMINASLYLDNHENESILVGGIEEATDTSIEVLQHAQVYRKENVTPQSMLATYKEGSIIGEGATFFLLKKEGVSGCLRVRDVITFTTRNTDAAIQEVNNFLAKNEMDAADADLVMLGINADLRNKHFYDALQHKIFKGVSQSAFKHLSGEYPVAGAFALGLLVHSLKQGLPKACILNHTPEKLKRILLINNYLYHYSCWYLEVV